MAPFVWSGVELTLPTETFDGELSVGVGAREVPLIEVEPAHTAGDAVVWVPDVSVCFAADILFIGCTPITWAGPIARSLAAIERSPCSAPPPLSPATSGLLPGGGRPASRVPRVGSVGGTSRLERGASPAKAAREMLLSREFQSLPWSCWDYPARLVITLSTERFRREGG